MSDKIIIRNKLKQMLGQTIKVYIDRPIGSKHPHHKDIIYKLNYGYIKEIIAEDNEFQDAYVLGIDRPIKCCIGKVYAIVEREDDNEDKVIVNASNKEYSIEEIKDMVDFQEQYFKCRIFK